MAIFLEIITLVVVLVVLILVHEFGHFVVAKLSGMRVDEFGIGYPPRALTIGMWGGTEYTLNWLPFGGFVKIYGEDGDNEEQITPGVESTVGSRPAFGAKPRILQALTLVAGIVMNLLFAYVLLTITLIIGTPQALTPNQESQAKNVQVALSGVNPGSPAAKAGLETGDIITNTMVKYPTVGLGYPGNDPLGVATLISRDSTNAPIIFTLLRNGKQMYATATPQEGLIASSPKQPALGITLTALGTIKTPILQAPIEGGIYTWEVIKETAIGLYNLFKGIFTFKADLSQLSGPIGIANAVGQANAQGIAALLSLTALISINLALVNLIPIPALDGGRLLFVLIEAITRKPINPKWAERINSVGFMLLIILMLVISGHDIFNIIHK